MNWLLGVVRDERGRLRAHRSLLKLGLNPLLRPWCWQIGTQVLQDGALGRPVLCRCPRQLLPRWRYRLEPGWRVQPVRRLW